MQKMMKRWQLTGTGLNNLILADVPVPVPGEHEVLIRVSAVSLNYRDLLVIDGKLLPELPEMPFTPASDMAGKIVAAGEKVTRFHNGDRVTGNFWTQWTDNAPPAEMAHHGLSLGGPLPGVLAEYIVLNEETLVAVPPSLTDEEASTLPVTGLTAWFALKESGDLQSGQTVLLQGTSGVSLAGLQIALAMGAKPVVLTRSAEKIARLNALGVTRIIDTRATPAWADAVMSLTGGHGADHILEVIGGENLRQSVAALAPGGHIAQIGFMQSEELVMPAVPLMLKQATIQGITVGHRRALERLCAATEQYQIKPVIDTVYPFGDVPAAFAHLQRGPFGKIVIRVK
ncbi:TPA: NAD(P)-dependent alcohol dehydrogenase [Morganella morganii subsp. morganii]|nr:NAD(P)-dependent alcohol dehydrogenase [Morganella morganii subsp. morganii]